MNWSVHNLVLCVLLFKYTVFYICCWFIRIEFTASIRHITAFSSLGTLDSTSALCLGTILTSEVTNKNHKNAKNMTLNRLWKGHLHTIWKLKQEIRMLPGSPSAGNMCIRQLKFFTALYMSMVTTKVWWLLILGLQINFSEQVNLQLCNPWIMKMNCVPELSHLKQHINSPVSVS